MATRKKTAKTPRKFKSLSDAYLQANGGDALACASVIGCLENFGCEHLVPDGPQAGRVKWLRYWSGLQQYMMSLVGEYGESEADAEREVLAELNNAVGYADIVKITD
jgi:hypothetical protein